jgi:hypothetical protein
MPRRPESAELAAAREQLRARYESQQAAASRFFDAAARLAELRAAVREVEVEQLAHAAALGDALGVAAAADLTGWSRTRIGEAQRSRRTSRAADSGDGAGEVES